MFAKFDIQLSKHDWGPLTLATHLMTDHLPPHQMTLWSKHLLPSQGNDACTSQSVVWRCFRWNGSLWPSCPLVPLTQDLLGAKSRFVGARRPGLVFVDTLYLPIGFVLFPNFVSSNGVMWRDISMCSIFSPRNSFLSMSITEIFPSFTRHVR